VQVEVETLRFQYQDLQDSCSQVQTSSSHQGQHQQQQQQQKEVEMHGGRTGDFQLRVCCMCGGEVVPACQQRSRMRCEKLATGHALSFVFVEVQMTTHNCIADSQPYFVHTELRLSI
jgi:hypothetical protein